jgi:hypothetical protein
LRAVKRRRRGARDLIFAFKSGCLGSNKPSLFPSPLSGLSSSKSESEIESRVHLKRPLCFLCSCSATDCFALFGVRAFYWGERALIYSPCTSANEKIYSNHTTRWIFDHSSRKKRLRFSGSCFFLPAAEIARMDFISNGRPWEKPLDASETSTS